MIYLALDTRSGDRHLLCRWLASCRKTSIAELIDIIIRHDEMHEWWRYLQGLRQAVAQTWLGGCSCCAVARRARSCFCSPVRRLSGILCTHITQLPQTAAILHTSAAWPCISYRAPRNQSPCRAPYHGQAQARTMLWVSAAPGTPPAAARPQGGLPRRWSACQPAAGWEVPRRGERPGCPPPDRPGLAARRSAWRPAQPCYQPLPVHRPAADSTSDMSEVVPTYNWQQSRITAARVKLLTMTAQRVMLLAVQHLLILRAQRPPCTGAVDASLACRRRC